MERRLEVAIRAVIQFLDGGHYRYASINCRLMFLPQPPRCLSSKLPVPSLLTADFPLTDPRPGKVYTFPILFCLTRSSVLSYTGGMKPPLPPILICGDSLLLAGLEAELRRAPGLQVQALKVSEILAETLKASPTFRVLVVYDQAETDLRQLAPWLADCPNLTLLGLDAEHDRVHVVTGQSEPVRAVGDLSRLVIQAAANRIR